MNKKQIIISLVSVLLVVVALVLYVGKSDDSIINKKTTSITDNSGTTSSTTSTLVTPDGKELTQYKTYAWNYFDTVTTIVGYTETGEEFEAITKEIFAMLEEYHKLYDIYN